MWDKKTLVIQILSKPVGVELVTNLLLLVVSDSVVVTNPE
jgi:hypothetical protein